MISFIKNLLGGSGANAKTLIAQGAKVIDVRSKAEFASGHFEGAVNIPLDQIDQKASTLKKEQAYILCCRSGMRSGLATSKLKALGFTNVHNGGSWTSL